MKITTLLDEEQLVKKAVTVLLEKLGPIESSRFLALPFSGGRLDSVRRHQRWQKELDKNKFFNQVFRDNRD